MLFTEVSINICLALKNAWNWMLLWRIMMKIPLRQHSRWSCLRVSTISKLSVRTMLNLSSLFSARHHHRPTTTHFGVTWVTPCPRIKLCTSECFWSQLLWKHWNLATSSKCMSTAPILSGKVLLVITVSTLLCLSGSMQSWIYAGEIKDDSLFFPHTLILEL